MCFIAKKKDWITAILLALMVAVLACMPLTSGHHFGDDFAGYLNTAFAISNGTLDEQIKLNLLMHPSPVSFLNDQAESLSYVWGYPLMLSAIYEIFGYDMVTYSTVVYYKLPVVVCYALLSAVLFLFYRRHFSYAASLFLTTIFIFNSRLWNTIADISPDLPFLLFFMACFWLIECMLAQPKQLRKGMIAAILGVCLWCAYVLRLNGSVAVGGVLAVHVLSLFFHPAQRQGKKWIHLLPYLIFGVLLAVSYAILPSPTSNTSDVGNITAEQIRLNIDIYTNELTRWANSLFCVSESSPLYGNTLPFLLFVLTVLGIYKGGRKERFPLAAILIGTLVTIMLLTYTQGLRYTYSCLPFVLLFAGYGLQAVSNWLKPHCDEALQRFSRYGVRILALLVAGSLVFVTAHASWKGFQRRGAQTPDDDAYSVYSIDLYRYIQEELPADATIAFFKPRALYLNTGRVSFKPSIASDGVFWSNVYLPYQFNTPRLHTADYLLLYFDFDQSQYQELSAELAANGASLGEPIYQSYAYNLYPIITQ